jgi:hypothetical protein
MKARFLFAIAASVLLTMVSFGQDTSLTIISNGNVGIGTTTPAAKLEIARDGSGDHPLIIRNIGSFPHFIGFFYGQDESKGWWLNTTSDGNFHIGAENLISNDGRVVIQDNTGNVGIGTNNPSQKLHVQKGSVGSFTPGANDISIFENNVAGYISILTPNSAERGILFSQPSNNAAGGIIYNNSSTLNGLQFRTNGNVNRMVIDASGKVGIGTTSPSQNLEIKDNASTGNIGISINSTLGNPQIRLLDNGATKGAMTWIRSLDLLAFNEGTTDLLNLKSGMVGIGTYAPDQLLSVNGNASKVGGGTWATFSDQRLKQDINTFTDGLSVIKAIRPVTFRYNGKLGYPTDKAYVGVIAQEIRSVAPYTVDTYRAKLNPDDSEETDVLRFDGSALIYIAINAIKELDTKMDEIRELQKQNQQISVRLAELEALVKSLADEKKNLNNKSMTELR